MNDENKNKFSSDGNVKNQQTKNNAKSGNKNKKKKNNNNSNNNQNNKKKKQQQNQKNNQSNKKKKQQQKQKNNQKNNQKKQNNNVVVKKQEEVVKEVVDKVEAIDDDFIEILDDFDNRVEVQQEEQPVEQKQEEAPESPEDFLQLDDGFVEAEDLSYRPGIDFIIPASDKNGSDDVQQVDASVDEEVVAPEEVTHEFSPSKEEMDDIIQRINVALDNIKKPEVEETTEDVVTAPVQEEVTAPVQEEVPVVESNNEVENNFSMTPTDTVLYDDDAVNEVNEDNISDNTEIRSIQNMGITVDGTQAISPDDTFYRDKTFAVVDEDPVVEEIREVIEERNNGTVNNNTQEVTATVPVTKVKKVYLSFQARVFLLVVGILLLFSVACYAIISALTSNNVRKVNYAEKTTIHYDVCQKVANPLNKVCLKENETYTANDTANVHVNYHYEAIFEEKIDYDLSYHVVVVNKIFDHNDKSKLLYEDEVLLLDKIKIRDGQNPVEADVTVEIDYEKYYKFVNEYRQKYSKNANSQLNVILYLDDGHDTRNVGEVVIPLTESKYKLTKTEVNNDKAEYPLVEKDWTNKNTVYIVVGSLFVVLSLFLLFHLTRLALAVTGKRSKYQDYLMDILNEYDRFIVIARDGYETCFASSVRCCCLMLVRRR